jgi:hypothetical protein
VNSIVLIVALLETTMLVGLAPEKVAVLVGTAAGDQLPAVFQTLPGPFHVASCDQADEGNHTASKAIPADTAERRGWQARNRSAARSRTATLGNDPCAPSRRGPAAASSFVNRPGNRMHALPRSGGGRTGADSLAQVSRFRATAAAVRTPMSPKRKRSVFASPPLPAQDYNQYSKAIQPLPNTNNQRDTNFAARFGEIKSGMVNLQHDCRARECCG